MLSHFRVGTLSVVTLLTSCAEETCEHRGDCDISAAQAGGAGGEGGPSQGGSPGGDGTGGGGAAANGESASEPSGGRGSSPGCLGTGTNCLIDGVCYRDGEHNPASECENCDALNPGTWSPRTGASCSGDGLFCTGPETCSSGGTCEPAGNPCNADQNCFEPERSCIDECENHPANPDADGDGAPDACDACPLGSDADEDRDGTPDACEAVDVAGGAAFNCAIWAAGSAICWGNCVGCTGEPLEARDGRPLVSITAGERFACALDDVGRAHCWGAGTRGQLGDGGLVDSPLPVQALGDRSFRTIDAGRQHVCATDTQGDVYCWGANDAGQTGFSEALEIREPTQVDFADEGVLFAAVACGGHDTHAISTEGDVYRWGWPSGAKASALEHVGPAFRKLHAGPSGLVCGLSDEGSAHCWGAGAAGMFGDGSERTTSDQPTPVTMPVGTSFETMALSIGSACAVSSEGEVYCWGQNTVGVLGVGDHEARLLPTHLTQVAHRVGAIGGGADDVCAVSKKGALFCWGSMHGPNPVEVSPLSLLER